VKHILYFYFICLIFFVCSCEHQELKPLDYVQYIENPKNGLHPTIEKIPFVFSLQYKPLDYVALEELRQPNVTYNQLKEEKKSFGNMQYFTLRISTTDSTNDVLKTGTSSKEDYSKRQNYFDFNIQRDLKLIEYGDTLPCRLCHCIRSYGLAPYSDFVLAFDGQLKDDGDIKFIYEDKMLKTGLVTFVITQNSITNIPKIKTD